MIYLLVLVAASLVSSLLELCHRSVVTCLSHMRSWTPIALPPASGREILQFSVMQFQVLGVILNMLVMEKS